MSLIPSKIKGVISDLSDILSADDADFETPPIVASGAYETLSGPTDPLAGKPNVAVMNISPVAEGSGVIASVKSSVSSAASSVSSAFSSLVSKVSGGTSSGPAAKSASSAGSPSSSWMIWALGAGVAAALYVAFKPKRKGGKSFLGKLGGKSSIKL